jgi:multidrug transporter EmrE-like cation transporter
MLQSFLLILASIMASVAGQYVLKVGAKQLGTLGVEQAAKGVTIAITAATNPWIIGGLACYGLGAVAWIMVLTRVPLSWAYPILALNQILVLMVAWLFLGETVGPMRWCGALLIVSGVVLVSRS